MSFKFSAAILVAGIVLAIPLASAATTCNSVAACVLGNNTGSGVGLEGVSQLNVALYGVSTANHGIDGRSRQSYGVVGYTFANGATEASGRAGVYGIDSGTGENNFGVIGRSSNGGGVFGTGMVGVTGEGTEFGVFGSGTRYGVIGEAASFGGYFLNNSSTNPSTILTNQGGGPLLEGGNGDTDLVSIDGAGNLILAGSVTQSGTPLIRTKTQGSDVASYGARTAAPTLEDFGTAQLRNGTAFVSLDRTFASAIDARSYLVFVTPHGNSNGLYAETSPIGFTVRENNRGNSTVAFDYRIVAKPLDTAATHLPAMAPNHRSTIRTPLTFPKLR
jgi:hypothetical protein